MTGPRDDGPGGGDEPYSDDDLTTIRVAQFLPHPPAKVWRALTTPELLAEWLMPGDFRLEVGHRWTMTALPRPNTRFSGTVLAEVLGYETGRRLTVRWRDAGAGAGAEGEAGGPESSDGAVAGGSLADSDPDPGPGSAPDPDPGESGADWTITWTLHPEGRGTRLFLVHEGFDPDDPAQQMARRIMGQGWRSSVMRGLEQLLARM